MKAPSIAIVVIAMTFIHLSAHAARIEEGVSSDLIDITGDIMPGDVQLVAELIKSQAGAMTIRLDSDGGDLYAAMSIGRLVRENELITMVPTYARCHSSCALIFIAGVTRVNAGIVGLHRPYLVGIEKNTAQVAAEVPKMLGDLQKYVAVMGITPRFYEIMVNTEPKHMRLFKSDAGSDLTDMVPFEDPTYQEIMIARMARQYGISSEQYRKRDLQTESCGGSAYELGKKPAKVISCEAATKWGLDVPTYVQRESRQKLCKWTSEMQAALNRSPPKGRLDSPLLIQHEKCIRDVMTQP